jgi:hypothetical protein
MASGPADLRLLAGEWILDADDPAWAQPSGITGWLARPGGEPQLIEMHPQRDEYGPVRASLRNESALPDHPSVVTLEVPALARLALSADGRGIWTVEYLDRTHCQLRQIDLTGSIRTAARNVPCGTTPIGETAAGLLLRYGPDAFVEQTEMVPEDSYRVEMVDPETLTAEFQAARVDLVDEHTVLVFPEPRSAQMLLRDTETGRSRPLPAPPARGIGPPSVGPTSPDGRWLLVTYADPGSVPQVLDVWVLDLVAREWTHMPSMPVFASLKATNIAWAPDGRVVIAGMFPTAEQPRNRELVVWHPGEPVLVRRPYDRQTGPFLVL